MFQGLSACEDYGPVIGGGSVPGGRASAGCINAIRRFTSTFLGQVDPNKVCKSTIHACDDRALAARVKHPSGHRREIRHHSRILPVGRRDHGSVQCMITQVWARPTCPAQGRHD
jgi:hypothetical protein